MTMEISAGRIIRLGAKTRVKTFTCIEAHRETVNKKNKIKNQLVKDKIARKKRKRVKKKKKKV